MKPHYPNLRPSPENLGVTRLEQGESTQTMRVRGPAEVLVWAATLSAVERGNIFATVYSSRHASKSGVLRDDSRAERVQIGPTFPRQSGAAIVVNELRQGGTLTEAGGVWTMTLPDGTSRTVGRHVMRDALREGVLLDTATAL